MTIAVDVTLKKIESNYSILRQPHCQTDHLFGKELFIRLTVRVFRGRWSNFVYFLLSLLLLRVGCGM